MPDHSPEPWLISAYGRHLGGRPWTVLSHPTGGAQVVAGCETEKDAKRIVACVNACKEISTDALESVGKPMDGGTVGLALCWASKASYPT
jgi:hypothetical protein